MLRPREAAEYLGVTTETLRAWRQRGVGPDYVQHEDGHARYPAERLVRYIETRTVRSTVGGAR